MSLAHIIPLKSAAERWTKASYAEYLRSDHWKNLRAAKLDESGHRCERCPCVKFLQVHHVNYRNIYDVQLSDLLVLCKFCHKAEHGLPIEAVKVDAAFYRRLKSKNGGRKEQPEFVKKILQKRRKSKHANTRGGRTLDARIRNFSFR